MTANRLEILLAVNDQATDRVKRAFKDMEDGSKRFHVESNRGLDEAKTKTDSVATSINRLKQQWLGAAIAVGSFVLAVRQVSRIVGDLVNTSVEFEKIKIQMMSFTENAAEAEAIFERIRKFSASTPFTLLESSQAAAILLPLRQMGYEIETLFKAAGNLSAAFNISLSESALNLSKAFSAGIAASDLFRERGVRTFLDLKYGIDTTKLSAEDLRELLIKEFTSPDSNIGKALDLYNSTFIGAQGELQDAWISLKDTLGDLITQSPEVITAMKGMASAMTELSAAIKGMNLGEFVNEIAVFFNGPLGPLFSKAGRGARAKTFDMLGMGGNEPVMLDKVTVGGGEQTEKTVSKFSELIGAIKRSENAMKIFQQAGQQAANSTTNAFSNLFFNVFTEGTTNAREVFAEFGRSVLRILAEMIAKMIVFGILLNAVGAAFGIPPGTLQAMGAFSLGGTKKHSGGRIAQFHSGGEVPAVLQSGEFVVNRHDAAKNAGLLNSINNGGRSQSGGVVVVNNINLNAVDAETSVAYLRRNKDVIGNLISEQIMLNSPLRDVIKQVA